MLHMYCYCLQVFFSLVMLIATLLALRNMMGLLLDYLHYPLVTEVRVERHSHLNFPAVTFCNINKIKAGHAQSFNDQVIG